MPAAPARTDVWWRLARRRRGHDGACRQPRYAVLLPAAASAPAILSSCRCLIPSHSSLPMCSATTLPSPFLPFRGYHYRRGCFVTRRRTVGGTRDAA
jgi:hypothetical protein